MVGRPPLAPGELRSFSVDVVQGKYIARGTTRDGGGQRRWVRAAGNTPEEAEQLLRLAARKLGIGEVELDSTATLASLLDAWILDREGLVRVQTLRAYSDTARWLKPIAGGIRIVEITPARVKAILGEVRRLRSDEATHHARVALSGAFGVAVESGLIDHNPVLSLRRRPRPRQLPKSLGLEQIAALRDAISRREQSVLARAGKRGAPILRWVVETQLGSGLRLGEVLALRYSDMDWSQGILSVTATMVDDAEWRNTRQSELKVRTQARRIELPAYLVTTLAEAWRANGDGPTARPDSPLIQGRSPGQHLHSRNVRRAMRDLRQDVALIASLRGCGLTSEDLTPHLLRRTAATLIATWHQDLRPAQHVLGHGSEMITENSYAGEAYRVVGSSAALDALLGGSGRIDSLK